VLIIPAIDLRDGRCVRLTQGDFSRETTYGDDPLAIARRWRDQGAVWLHVVDLDGARAGQPRQLDSVARIAGQGVPVELGGGLRTASDVAAAFGAGVARVILGTAAVENPTLLADLVAEHGSERVVLGVDARRGRVAVRGWESVVDQLALSVVERARDVGVTRVIYTDIERDGTLTSPNFAETRVIAGAGVAVIASGGVSRRDDLERLATIPGVEAAIVGRALYTGHVVVHRATDWWVTAPMAGAGAGDRDDLAQ